MLKISTVFLTLIFCSAVFAEPVVYVCERPAWEGKEGCGPNNTYYTYAFHVETDDFSKEKPKYTFQMRKGCDASTGRRIRYSYKVTEETLMFRFQRMLSSNPMSYSTVKLDRESMIAVMSKVKHSPELSCRREKSESWILKNNVPWTGADTPLPVTNVRQ